MDYKFTSTRGGAFDELLPYDINDKQNIISLGVTNLEGVPIGVIAASLNNYSYEIVWLYIREEERGKGVASALMREFLSVIRKTNYIFPVSMRYDSSAEEIMDFMDSLSFFRRNSVGKRFYIDSDRRKKSDIISKLLKYESKRTDKFFAQSEHMRIDLYRRLNERGIDIKGLISEFSDGFFNELCLCHKTDKIDALILVREISEKEMDVAFAYAQNSVYFAYVLIEVLRRINDNYSNMSLSITTLSTESELCVRHLFGNDAPYDLLLREEWNYLLD